MEVILPLRSNRMARELVVPWSSARMYCDDERDDVSDCGMMVLVPGLVAFGEVVITQFHGLKKKPSALPPTATSFILPSATVRAQWPSGMDWGARDELHSVYPPASPTDISKNHHDFTQHGDSIDVITFRF